MDVPSYSSNDVALQQLSAGKIDYAGNFVSQIEQSFVAKDPANHKYWFPAINTVGLVFNVNSGPEALKDPAVRKAISAGLRAGPRSPSRRSRATSPRPRHPPASCYPTSPACCPPHTPMI